MSPPSDAQVQWFDALYRRCHQRVLDYARRRVDPGAAEDVVAEVFAAAWRRREVCDVDLGWLIKAAANVVLHEHRSAGRRDRLATRVAGGGGLDAVDPIERVAGDLDDAGRVAAAMATLTASDRELLRLVAWDQLTPREIAVVVGCSGAAARVRIHRAGRRLAAALTSSPVVADATPVPPHHIRSAP